MAAPGGAEDIRPGLRIRRTGNIGTHKAKNGKVEKRKNTPNHLDPMAKATAQQALDTSRGVVFPARTPRAKLRTDSLTRLQEHESQRKQREHCNRKRKSA